MPRAHRHFLSGHVWHITHRCHKQEFLLRFGRDRDCWRYWLYQARQRYGLSVLNFIVTSNHVHLLVRDRGKGEIPKSMQLVAGQTAQAYNRRKQRKGAYWEDRYHATAVEADNHLAQCMVYIDLNMVRAGIIDHPSQWRWSGYQEIQEPSERYRVIDYETVKTLFNTPTLGSFQDVHREWINKALSEGLPQHDHAWSSSLAIGSASYVNNVKDALGISFRKRSCIEEEGKYYLREEAEAYQSVFGG
jgi:putative transposase